MSYKPKTFMNRSKCEKTQFSFTFRLITFFWFDFFQLFQRIWIQYKILRLLVPLISFSKKFFFGSFKHFLKLWNKIRMEWLKKKNAFSKCVLEFNFAPISGPYFFIKKKVKIDVPFWTFSFWGLACDHSKKWRGCHLDPSLPRAAWMCTLECCRK